MDRKFVFGMMCMLASVFMACEHNGVYNKGTDEVEELKVPAGFEWNMSKDVALTISAPVETSVDVYEDAACKLLLGTLPVSSEKVTYNLSTETDAGKLYVKYPKADGTMAVQTVVIVATKAASDGSAELKLPEDTGKKGNDGWIYYPAKSNGWGSLLFEDMWPEKGDYDFNDLAAWYKIQVAPDVILVGVRLNALGGYLPYQLCLQIDGVEARHVEQVTGYTNNNPQVNSFKFETTGEDYAVFSFDWKNKKGSNGGNYYNTELKNQVASSGLDENMLAIQIYLDGNVSVSQLKHTSFNFFIRRTDNGKEIHLRGYEPTKAFKEQYDKIVSENAALLKTDIPYCSADGLVWGLKVPQGINHAQEEIDFTKAYKFFGEWVTSGGKEKKNWYEENAGKEYRIDVGKNK